MIAQLLQHIKFNVEKWNAILLIKKSRNVTAKTRTPYAVRLM